MTSDRTIVIGGPSKFDLMLALFAKDKTVWFILEEGVKMEVIVLKIEAADGSCESWNLAGYLVGDPSQRFCAYFNTQKRQGWFELTD